MIWDSIGPADQIVAEVTIQVDEDAPLGAQVENIAHVSCLDPETYFDNNEVTVTEIIGGFGSVTGTKTVSGQFVLGGEVVYTVVLSNAGPGIQADGAGDEFVDPLPPGVVLIDASVIDGGGTAVADIASNTVTWNGSIPPGGTVTLEIRGTVAPVIANQGFINIDSDGDGVYDAQRPTDDPTTPEPEDATLFQFLILSAVPAVSGTGLVILALALLATGFAIIQRVRSS
jgi:uncharacterized repeat protein (TIGR01451 family)